MWHFLEEALELREGEGLPESSESGRSRLVEVGLEPRTLPHILAVLSNHSQGLRVECICSRKHSLGMPGSLGGP